MSNPDRFILAVETSNPRSVPGPAPAPAPGGGGIAVGRLLSGGGIEPVGRRGLEPSSRHDDALMPAIAALCADAGITPRDLATIAVSVGPGGYTSIRIAVATATLLAHAVGAGCIAVPTDEAVIRRIAPGEAGERPVVVTLAWKRDSVWARTYRFKGGVHEAQAPGEVVGLEPFAERLGAESALLVADEEFLGVLAGRGLADARWSVVPPTFDPIAVLEAAVGRTAGDPSTLTPAYAREPEAVTRWRELHGPAPA